MKPAALAVISVKPGPDVSTCKVALAISCGAASTTADIRPGMDRLQLRGCLALAHHVLLNSDNHLHKMAPGLFYELAGTCKFLVGRQFDCHVVAFVARRRKVCRR